MRRGAVPCTALAAAAILLVPAVAGAHIGSPEVFHQGTAGPYKVLVTVQVPEAIPGIAAVEVRVTGGAAAEVTLVPTPLTGEGADLPPRPDRALRSPQDQELFSGRLWIMEKGAWRVRVQVAGAAGAGTLDVPVAALPARIRPMGAGLGGVLAALMALLLVALVALARAAVGEAQRPPGLPPSAAERRRTRIATAIASVVAAAAVGSGILWWSDEARLSQREVYQPLPMSTTLAGRSLSLVLQRPPAEPIRLRFGRPYTSRVRRPDDLVADHGHLMHLFAVRLPSLDAILHLHPDRVAPGRFLQQIPGAPPGPYRLFADIVHESGVPETLTATVDLPEGGGAPTGDDAVGAAPPAEQPPGGAISTATLADGTRVVWTRDQAGPLPSARALWFRFRITDPAGQPASDLEPYMGMAGHAVFLARDGSVFAHVHPSGSVPMASLAIAAPHAMHAMHPAPGPLPAEVAFPYGFPKPGAYRIFFQFKRAGIIETASFDVTAR